MAMASPSGRIVAEMLTRTGRSSGIATRVTDNLPSSFLCSRSQQFASESGGSEDLTVEVPADQRVTVQHLHCRHLGLGETQALIKDKKVKLSNSTR